MLPPLPRKNKSNSTASNLLGGMIAGNDSEVSSISSASTQTTGTNGAANGHGITDSMKKLNVRGM